MMDLTLGELINKITFGDVFFILFLLIVFTIILSFILWRYESKRQIEILNKYEKMKLQMYNNKKQSWLDKQKKKNKYNESEVE